MGKEFSFLQSILTFKKSHFKNCVRAVAEERKHESIVESMPAKMNTLEGERTHQTLKTSLGGPHMSDQSASVLLSMLNTPQTDLDIGEREILIEEASELYKEKTLNGDATHAIEEEVEGDLLVVDGSVESREITLTKQEWKLTEEIFPELESYEVEVTREETRKSTQTESLMDANNASDSVCKVEETRCKTGLPTVVSVIHLQQDQPPLENDVLAEKVGQNRKDLIDKTVSDPPLEQTKEQITAEINVQENKARLAFQAILERLPATKECEVLIDIPSSKITLEGDKDVVIQAKLIAYETLCQLVEIPLSVSLELARRLQSARGEQLFRDYHLQAAVNIIDDRPTLLVFSTMKENTRDQLQSLLSAKTVHLKEDYRNFMKSSKWAKMKQTIERDFLVIVHHTSDAWLSIEGEKDDVKQSTALIEAMLEKNATKRVIVYLVKGTGRFLKTYGQDDIRNISTRSV